MAKGGARPGAGRKKGGINRVSLSSLEALKDEYKKMPVDVLMSYLHVEVPADLPAAIKLQYEERIERIAVALMPYTLPKLSSVDTNISGDVNISISTGVPDRDQPGDGAKVVNVVAKTLPDATEDG